MSAFATAAVVFTSCSAARAGVMGKTRRGASIANWACNYATKRPSAGSRPSCAMTARRPRGRTRPGRWTSSMTSWRRDTSFACLRSSISSPASRRRCSHGSPSAAATSWRYWKGPARKWDSRRRSGSIKAASSYRAILTCGPTSAASRWTSHGPASRPTTRSSRPSTAASGPNASTPIGSSALQTPSKRWRLGADTTTAHQNTHLSMLLKERDFAGRELVPRGVSHCCPPARRSTWRHRSQARPAQISKRHPAAGGSP
ncbi:hypothetical protein ACVJGD_005450 [Bradyrhizobium sp. USDA 10063]